MDGTTRPSRYDVLFEPVRIGPKTTRNRFYQVPHCNGMGYRDPTAMAAMRGIKAEGGWGVVCTEEVEIHPSGEITPFIEMRLWDEQDLPAHARIVEAIHEHGSLAGIELCHNGIDAPNLWSREVPMGPSALPVHTFAAHPVQGRAMDKADIRALRDWHRLAAIRAADVGYDLVYVYAAHSLTILQHFLSKRLNQRSDEYGGSLENRGRLLREVIEDTKEAVGDRCGIPVRISLADLSEEGFEPAEIEDLIGSMAELPDLWDVTLSGWEHDSQTARFAEEGYEEPFSQGIKRLTTKPVVGVGRYTSVDRMVSLIRKGVLDLIGAARPSIADPFLPKKIEEGRFEDIRECIGCNICVSGDFWMAPIRCTQNPTMGDEWRRGWHPERVRPAGEGGPVLIVGAGPAGLEAAHVLGKRGYDVTLADAGTELGGRVLREARLPGLASWIRVRDYRAQQLLKLPNVETYLESAMTADQVLELGHPRVVVATGAIWRRDGVAHRHTHPMPVAEGTAVLTPDDIMAGARPHGPVLIWDDDHAYMGGVVAELLASEGHAVALATTAPQVSKWMEATMEQSLIQARLIEAGVTLHLNRAVERIAPGEAVLSCSYTGREERVEAATVVMVTSRAADDTLATALRARAAEWADAGIAGVTAIGDALAPATVAHAVHAGRRYAEELDEDPARLGPLGFRREVTGLAAQWPQ